jgi:hypothetical protein
MESDMNNRVLSANESVPVFIAHDADHNPVTFDKSNPLSVSLNKERFRVSVEICYCSTMGECWTLRAGGLNGPNPNSTAECRSCPSRSELTFQQ